MIEGIANHQLFVAGAVLVGLIGLVIGLESRMERKKLEYVENGIERLVEERDFYAHTLQAIEMSAHDMPPIDGYERVVLMTMRSHMKRIRKVAREALEEYGTAEVLGAEESEPIAQVAKAIVKETKQDDGL